MSEHAEDFDAAAEETFDSPYETYADLRQRCPAAWSDAYGGFWTFSRYRDVVDAVTDTDTYITSVVNVVPNMALGVRRPPLGKDPPEHTPFRKALDRTLKKARIDRLEPVIRAHAARELQRMIDAGGGDISQDFATIFPAWVAAEWLNLEPEVVPQLAKVSQLYNVAWRGQDMSAVKATGETLYAIAREVVADRRANPRPIEDDPASALLAERWEGKPIDDELVIATIRQVLVVNLMAPPPFLGSVFIHLTRHPDLQDQLRREPHLIEPALEELLRLYTPYRGFARSVRHDTVVHGRTIQPGEPIAMSYSAANRDPDVFPDPDAFEWDRPNITEHVAFGRGPHRCAGMALARLEFRVALQEALARTSRIDLAGEIAPTRLPELGSVSTPLRMMA